MPVKDATVPRPNEGREAAGPAPSSQLDEEDSGEVIDQGGAEEGTYQVPLTLYSHLLVLTHEKITLVANNICVTHHSTFLTYEESECVTNDFLCLFSEDRRGQ